MGLCYYPYLAAVGLSDALKVGDQLQEVQAAAGGGPSPVRYRHRKAQLDSADSVITKPFYWANALRPQLYCGHSKVMS